MILVYVVCRDRDEARRIARSLVENRLAAGTNIFPIESLYWWQGQIVEDNEVVLIVKTRAGLFEAIRDHVKGMHSYEVPAIICLPITNVNREYVSWVETETGQRQA